MSSEMIVRAWKDPQFRSQVDAAALPPSPVGDAKLIAAELQGDAYHTSPACTDYGPRCSEGSLC